MEKMGRMMPWIFYFGWVKSLVIGKMHYVMIIMQAMVVEMLWNDNGMFFCSCCCSFIWVPVVVSWWVMAGSLCSKSVCLETLWIYQENTVEGLYRRRGYSGGVYTGSVYSGEGASAKGASAKGYSGGYSLGGRGIATDNWYSVKDMVQVYIKCVDEDMQRVYVGQVYDKIMYGQHITENKRKRNDKKGG